jgi:hypothetical protein
MADQLETRIEGTVVKIPSHKVGRTLVALFIVDDLQVVRSWVIGHVERAGRRKWDAFSPKTDLHKAAGEPLVDGDFDHERFVREYEAHDWLLGRFQDRLDILAQGVAVDV